MVFSNWDCRPAVSLGFDRAFAGIEPNGPWVKVDAADVSETAGVLSEDVWRQLFEASFGPLDLATHSKAQD